MSYTPTDVSGLITWFQAGDIAQADSSAVSSWTDRVGSVAVTQATVANQPTYRTTGFQGQPGVLFNSTTTLLSGTLGSSPAQPVSCVVIGSSADPAANQRQPFSATGGTDQIAILSDSGVWTGWAATALTIGPAATTNPSVLMFVVNGASSVVYANGTGGTASSPGTNVLGSALTIGAHQSPMRFWNGYIADLLFYNRALTANDRAIIDTYAAQRYGVVVSDLLPIVQHPVRSTTARRRASLW